MLTARTVREVREFRRPLARAGLSLGLVPTMGYLHDGHLSLVRAARAENDRVAATIFVNPTQFNDPGDLAAYPRDEPRDLSMLEAAGVDLVYVPEVGEVYPPGYSTRVQVERLTARLEGASRPGHFAGVATVVAKLFALFRPERAYFGAKDAQQARVIRQLERDLDFGIEVRVMPTVREADGLAMSSRNARLGPAERAQAGLLYRALEAGCRRLREGGCDAEAVRREMRQVLAEGSLLGPEYVSVADPEDLVELTGPIRGAALLSLAVRVGEIRLIDNMTVGGRCA